MTRWIGSLTSVCLVLALVATAPCAGAASVVTDAAGRAVTVPDRVARVIPAGPPAAALLYTLAPQTMLGWPHAPDAASRAVMTPEAAALPELGPLVRDGIVDEALVRRLNPDLILDVGTVSPRYVEEAKRVQAATGVPYLLLDGRLEETAGVYRLLGPVLGESERGEGLAAAAERILAETRNAVAKGATAKPPLRAYYGRGRDGLTTAGPQSVNGEVLSLLGLDNVAGGTGATGLVKTNADQLRSWNPDVVLTLDQAFAESLRRDPAWAGLGAVTSGRVLVAPQLLFGSIDEPPGVNRLLGLRWGAHALYPEASSAPFAEKLRAFYLEFYGIDLDDAELDHLLATR